MVLKTLYNVRFSFQSNSLAAQIESSKDSGSDHGSISWLFQQSSSKDCVFIESGQSAEVVLDK